MTLRSLPDRYRVIDELWRDRHAVLYRGEDRHAQQNVILRLPASVGAGDAEAIRREYRILSNLPSAAAESVIELTGTATTPILVLVDYNDTILTEVIDAGGMALARFLPIAIKMAAAVSDIHRQGVMHGDIRPDHFRLYPDDARIQIGGFARAAYLSDGTLPRSVPTLEDDFRYVSPEQTGRMNRAIDWRSDLYSLGLTFYQMVSGALPFDAVDSMGWIHCHIAVPPMPLHQVKPGVPPALSAIIDKLLSKDAAQRYQSADGLRLDLEAAYAEWRETGNIVSIVPGEHDGVRALMQPQRLYGRDAEIETLLAAADRASKGTAELVLLAGPSGIGKSALARAVQTAIVGKGSYFSAGKFDQLQGDIPYLAIIQALRSLVDQILSEDSARFEAAATALRKLLGQTGAVVTNVLPELERIVGAQPPLPELPPVEAQSRFHLTMAQFVRQFGSHVRPIVLFLDDLQWADAASLKLLSTLLTEPDCRHILIIGTYRENEVAEDHPLREMLSEIGQSVTVSTLMLEPLGGEKIERWLADALNALPDDVAMLAQSLTRKSGGNPFFLVQLATALAGEGLIRFEALSGGWSSDVPAIEAMTLPDDVAVLLAQRLDRLAPETQATLSMAACIGNRFGMATLAKVRGVTLDAVRTDLLAALRGGFVTVDESSGDEARYRFTHDRVQQAAYQLVEADTRPLTHLRIGRSLRDGAGDFDAALFDIVHQLNLGRAHIADQAELTLLCRLNYQAGIKARLSGAFDRHHDLTAIAAELLSPAHPRTFHLEIYLEAAKAAYLNRNFRGVDAYLEKASKLAKGELEQAGILEVTAQSLYLQGDYTKALDTVLAGTRLLGVKLSDSRPKLDIALGIIRLRLALIGKSKEDLAAIPLMTDPKALQVMRLLAVGVSASYIVGSPIYAAMSLTAARWSLRKGMTAYSAAPIAISGWILVNAFGDVDRAYALGRLSLSVGERFGDYNHVLIHSSFIQPWKERISAGFDMLLDAHEHLHLSGSFEFASYAVISRAFLMLHANSELSLVKQALADARAYARQINSSFSLDHSNVVLSAVRTLTESEPTEAERSEDAPFRVDFSLDGLKLAAALALGDIEEAAALVRRIRSSPLAVIGNYWFPVTPYHEALTWLPEMESGPRRLRFAARRRIKRSLRYVRWGARHAPMNHTHRALHIEAELARQAGKIETAMHRYDAAIECAAANDFWGDAGLIAEYAARFQRDSGNTRRADALVKESYAFYKRWGATAKLRQMEKRFPSLLARLDEEANKSQAAVEDEAFRPDDAVDLATVIKVGRAVAGELVLDRLVERLLDYAMENAGARFGALVLSRDGNLVVAMERKVDLLGPGAPLERPLAQSDLPAPLLHYVERSLESVVIDDAVLDERFGLNARWARSSVRSVLCVPIVHRGEFTGALYLDHDMAAGVFTPSRVELLNVLASQAAIALTNARLFAELDTARDVLSKSNEDLERKVTERTAELASARNKALAEEAEARRAKLEAEAANEAKSRFLAIVSHEIRTPMNGVLGVLQLLRKEKLDPRHRRYIEVAGASGETLLSLVDDILDFARLEVDVESLDMRDFELGLLVETAVELIRPLVMAKDLSFDVEVAADASTLLRGDQIRLNRVLLNLLGNAVKFTSQGGIRVRVALDEPTATGAKLRVEVTDTGIGIPVDKQELIFEDFVQADDTIARGFGGTGLGLAISRRLAVLMGGALTVESCVGAGSTFSLSVPVGFAKKHVDAPKRIAATRALHVLLVDDDPVNLTVAGEMLQYLGHRVTTMKNGKSAVDAVAASSDFDVVMMDVHMPHMDGIEASRLIRELPGGDLPIFALTADLTERSLQLLAEVGIETRLAKPFMLDTLSSALATVGGASSASARDALDPVALIDRHILDMQVDTLGPKRLLPLAKLFHRTSRQLIAELQVAVSSGDRVTAQRLAHQLYSASSAFGFGRLCASAVAIEVSTPEMTDQQLVAMVEDLAALRLASLKALSAVARA